MDWREELEGKLIPAETLLWQGRPKFACYFLETVFNPLGLLAVGWLALDWLFWKSPSTVLVTDPAVLKFLSSLPGVTTPEQVNILAKKLFVLLHSMFAWMYVGWAAAVFLRYHKSRFFSSDQAIYVTHWFFGKRINVIKWINLHEFRLRRTWVDRLCGAGDVVLRYSFPDEVYQLKSFGRTLDFSPLFKRNHGVREVLCDIEDYPKALSIILQAKSAAQRRRLSA